jgi:predicted nucleic acid-binding protein
LSTPTSWLRDWSARIRVPRRSRFSFTAITSPVSGVATHPEDDLILAAAVSAQADYLVTGDARLQALGSYQGVKIVTPREFVQILEQQ